MFLLLKCLVVLFAILWIRSEFKYRELVHKTQMWAIQMDIDNFWRGIDESKKRVS